MSDARKPPTISAVLTVYNKAAFLPDTIRSLRRQAEDEREVEYVFVDDASCDDSVSIIKKLTADAPRVRVIENADNRGPSTRLNQGAAAAAGAYLYLLDGDDIATRGAMIGMLRLLREEQADFIYGKTAKQSAPGVELFDIEADPDMPHSLSDKPFETVLGGGFVRMALMCRRDLFMAAGGADERVFVQDESLPLRLAARAKRMIDWQATVIAMPPPADGTEKVSGNKSQLHHDAFLAYRLALQDFGERHPDLAPKLYARAISAYWKHARRRPGAAVFKPGFWRYLQVKIGRPKPRSAVLAWMQSDFAALSGIRRM
ncbi:MAG: glycosyltransferase [Alphaproteobacteria bacterium]|nr:glycosyltransferase [Alphaproteobacteria bacterium]